MTVKTFTAGGGRYIDSNDADYETARAGADLDDHLVANLFTGQKFDTGIYTCYESFTRFNFTGLEDDAVLENIHFELRLPSPPLAINYQDIIAKVSSYGADIDPTWIAGDDIAALDDVGTYIYPGGSPSTFIFPDEPSLLPFIDPTGVNYLFVLIAGANFVNDVAPVGDETMVFAGQPATTALKSKLVVTYHVEKFVNINAALTPSGAVTKKTKRELVSSMSSVGTMTKKPERVLVGSLAMSAATTWLPKKNLGGELAPIGARTKKVGKALESALLFMGGAVAGLRLLFQSVGGSLGISGVPEKMTQRSISSKLRFAGSLSRTFRMFLEGVFAPVGEHSRRIFGRWSKDRTFGPAHDGQYEEPVIDLEFDGTHSRFVDEEE